MMISRRALVTGASIAAVAAPRPAWAQSLASGQFTHGVASGDPLSDRVVLWTRFIGGDGRIAYEVAEDEGFQRVVRRGRARASALRDFCVKVDVGGLAPGRPYFYRFLSGAGPSVTGRTRTAPRAGAQSLTAAVFSCSNYPFGYFHAYGHAAAREDIDVALHTGDYIYEYERGVYPNAAEAIAARVIEPANEIVTLAEYYGRYGNYHTDPDLLELRRLKPMSVVWDDHELTNDTWREGAQNHQPATEGDFFERMAAASKAYFDWMPIRPPERRGARIYRSLDWGDLARIILLDTRFIGRDRQLDYRRELLPRLAEGGADAARIIAEFRQTALDNPNRTLLGAEQERWFAEQLAQSKGRGHTWQLIAQQIIVGEQIAAPGMSSLLPETAGSGTRQWIQGGEQLGAFGLPWNLDSWGGYQAARARFLEACAQAGSNVVVVAGDSHNCWLNNLPSSTANRMAAIELAGGSVASPGFERTLSNAAPGQREATMRAGNPNLAWCDLTRRGYATVRLTREACHAEWVGFDDVRTPTATAPSIARFSAAPSASAGPSPWALA